jgi:hypothetical protein
MGAVSCRPCACSANEEAGTGESGMARKGHGVMTRRAGAARARATTLQVELLE